jgi:hypothetical protein
VTGVRRHAPALTLPVACASLLALPLVASPRLSLSVPATTFAALLLEPLHLQYEYRLLVLLTDLFCQQCDDVQCTVGCPCLVRVASALLKEGTRRRVDKATKLSIEPSLTDGIPVVVSTIRCKTAEIAITLAKRIMAVFGSPLLSV